MATIQIDSQRVQKACENFIVQRKLRIERERDELVKSYVGRRVSFLSSERYTYESAKAMLLSEVPAWLECRQWDSVSWKGGAWQDKAERLLALAILGNPVTLSEKDVWIMEYENVSP